MRPEPDPEPKRDRERGRERLRAKCRVAVFGAAHGRPSSHQLGLYIVMCLSHKYCSRASMCVHFRGAATSSSSSSSSQLRSAECLSYITFPLPHTKTPTTVPRPHVRIAHVHVADGECGERISAERRVGVGAILHHEQPLVHSGAAVFFVCCLFATRARNRMSAHTHAHSHQPPPNSVATLGMLPAQRFTYTQYRGDMCVCVSHVFALGLVPNPGHMQSLVHTRARECAR